VVAAELRSSPPTAAEVAAVAQACLEVDGADPLAHLPDHAERVAFAAGSGDEVAGVAVLVADRDGWLLVVATQPEHRCSGVAGVVLSAALAHADSHGAAPVRTWVQGADAAADALAYRYDFVLSRRLLRLEVALPLVSPAPWPEGFELGVLRDEELAAVADVNNRAFAWHEDQGNWSVESLRAKLSQDWVERDGFLVARTGSRDVAGFCWTKRHGGRDPVGEIFVICADPAFQGSGLGAALTAAGLEHLAAGGVDTAMLYVDDGNVAARRTYRRLGFNLARIDTRFTRDRSFRSHPFSGLA